MIWDALYNMFQPFTGKVAKRITGEKYFNNAKLNKCEGTGCPNKHGNSVKNSISSFQMII